MVQPGHVKGSFQFNLIRNIPAKVMLHATDLFSGPHIQDQPVIEGLNLEKVPIVKIFACIQVNPKTAHRTLKVNVAFDHALLRKTIKYSITHSLASVNNNFAVFSVAGAVKAIDRGLFRLAICGIDAVRHFGQQRSVRLLHQFMHNQVSAPFITAVIAASFFCRHPSESVAFLSVSRSLSRIPSARIPGIDIQSGPRSGHRTAHAIMRQKFVRKGRIGKVPPVAHFEQIGAFMGKIHIRLVHGLANLPIVQVIRPAAQHQSAAFKAGGILSCG